VDEELQRALSVGVGTLKAMAGVMEDPPPFGRVMELGESTVTVRFHGWVDQRSTDFLKVRSEAIRLVKAGLDAAGIVMPEPTYRVLTRALPEPKAPAATLPDDVEREAAHIDVAPDHELERQVLDELEESEGENLLP
jgi:small conductance mechanosensitive channel